MRKRANGIFWKRTCVKQGARDGKRRRGRQVGLINENETSVRRQGESYTANINQTNQYETCKGDQHCTSMHVDTVLVGHIERLRACLADTRVYARLGQHSGLLFLVVTDPNHWLRFIILPRLKHFCQTSRVCESAQSVGALLHEGIDCMTVLP